MPVTRINQIANAPTPFAISHGIQIASAVPIAAKHSVILAHANFPPAVHPKKFLLYSIRVNGFYAFNRLLIFIYENIFMTF